MRVLFIEVETESQWAHAAMGPACIGAYLRENGHTAALLRAASDQPIEEVLTGVRKQAPDLVGFSITTRQWRQAAAIAGEIKQRLNLPTIAGGLHATFAPQATLRSGNFDYLCLGEGETALADLLDTLETTGPDPVPDILNIWVSGKKRPGIRPPCASLDALPFAARDLLDEIEGVVHMGTARGCPFPCSYCAAGAIDDLYGDRSYLRRRSVDNVIGELGAIRSAGPLHYVIFLDDTFTLDRPWLETFCEVFGREIGAGFSIHARVETLGRDLIGMLADAGCRHIVVGVESGSRRVREEILKRPGPDQKFIDAFKWIRQAGMLATANYMIGIPGETRADIEKTLSLNRRLKPDDFGYFVFYPHPGTPLSKTCLEKGYLQEGYLDLPVDYRRSVLNLPGLTGAEIEAYSTAFAHERERLYRNRAENTL